MTMSEADDTNDDINQNNNNDNTTLSEGAPDNNNEDNEGRTEVTTDDLPNSINGSSNNLNNGAATMSTTTTTTTNGNNNGDGTRDMTNDNCSDDEEEMDEVTLLLKEKFDEAVDTKLKNARGNNVILIRDDQYDECLDLVRNWVEGVPNRPRWHYTAHEKFVAIAGSHKNALRLRPTDGNITNANIKIATKEKMFGIIHKAHKDLGHPRGSRPQITHIKRKWYGIIEEYVKIYCALCPDCTSRRRRISAKQRPLKMIISETIGKRAQMDLIDMSSQEDPKGYKWILRLVDHLSNHGHVRPLFTKTAEECGTAIIQILSSSIDFDILQSDNGGEFLGKTIEFVNK